MTISQFLEKAGTEGIEQALQHLSDETLDVVLQQRRIAALAKRIPEGNMPWEFSRVQCSQIAYALTPILQPEQEGLGEAEATKLIAALLRDWLGIPDSEEEWYAKQRHRREEQKERDRKMARALIRHMESQEHVDLSPMPQPELHPLQELPRLIARDELELALRHLRGHTGDRYQAAIKDLEKNLQDTFKYEKLGLLSTEALSITRSQQAYAMLELMKQLEESSGISNDNDEYGTGVIQIGTHVIKRRTEIIHVSDYVHGHEVL